jgi:hypothetical protein
LVRADSAVAEGLVALLKSDRATSPGVAVRALWCVSLKCCGCVNSMSTDDLAEDRALCDVPGGCAAVGDPRLGVYKSLTVLMRGGCVDTAVCAAGVLGALAQVRVPLCSALSLSLSLSVTQQQLLAPPAPTRPAARSPCLLARTPQPLGCWWRRTGLCSAR